MQLVPESMGERECSMFDTGSGKPLAGRTVDVNDLFRRARLAIEHMGEDGFLDDWNGRPG